MDPDRSVGRRALAVRWRPGWMRSGVRCRTTGCRWAESILGIDGRPATGRLYGLGITDRLGIRIQTLSVRSNATGIG
jgi:hypothetical protein